MHLGMLDGDYPYVVPLHYGYCIQEGRLQLFAHSAKEGHKLDCMKSNDKVFVEIDRGENLVTADIPCGYGAVYESVMGRGKAVILEDPTEKAMALELLMQTQTGEKHAISPKMAEAVAVIRIDVESFTVKARRS